MSVLLGIMCPVVDLPRTPKGVLHAVKTRDGEGVRRGGQPYYQVNCVWTDPSDGPICKGLFADGLWRLAATADLDVLE